MAEPFDGTSPGSETRRYADYIDPVAGEELYAGEAVALNSSGEAVRASDGDAVLGIAYIHQDAGERVTVKTRGTVVALITTNAAVGGSVGGHSGTDADFGDGDLSADGDAYYVLDSGTKTNPRTGNDDQYAEVDKF